MQNFANLQDALAAISGLTGFIMYRKAGEEMVSRLQIDENEYVVTRVIPYEYAQTVPAGTGHRWRQALVIESQNIVVQGGEEQLTVSGYQLSLPVIDESAEGYKMQVNSISGPGQYYPWVESIEISIERDGSDAEPLDANKQPCAVQDAVWFRKTARSVAPVESGIQQALGAWSRCNEGDHFGIAVDMPDGNGGWAPIPTPGGGTVRFADKVVIHGTNTCPTGYPPQAPPNVSWLPAGCALRVDFYKKAVNDPELVNQRGPYADIDLILWRSRE